MKYEYLTTWFNVAEKEKIDKELNKIGKKGWELCGIYKDMVDVFVFKRKLKIKK